MLTIRVCAGEGRDGPLLSICIESHDTCCRENRCDQPTSVYSELLPVLRMDPRFLSRDLAQEIRGLLSRYPDSMSLEGPNVHEHNGFHFAATHPRMF